MHGLTGSQVPGNWRTDELLHVGDDLRHQRDADARRGSRRDPTRPARLGRPTPRRRRPPGRRRAGSASAVPGPAPARAHHRSLRLDPGAGSPGVEPDGPVLPGRPAAASEAGVSVDSATCRTLPRHGSPIAAIAAGLLLILLVPDGRARPRRTRDLDPGRGLDGRRALTPTRSS